MDRPIESKLSKKKKIAFTIAALLTAVFAYNLISKSASSKVSSANVERSRLVISSVITSEFQEYIPLRATVESSKSVFVDAVEGGRIEAIHVKEGAIVEEGQTILTLSNARLQLDVIAREAQATEQLNNLRNTQLALEINTLDLKQEIVESNFQILSLSRRLKSLTKLYNVNAVSKDEFDALQEEIEYWENRKSLSEERVRHDRVVRATREKQLKSSIELLEDNLDMARSVLGGLEIKAPLRGKLTSLNAELGESKSQGVNLGIIDDINNFKATTLISEFYINRVSKGQIAEVSFNNEKYMMQIDRVLPEVANSQFRVELSFKDEVPPNLRRGQTLNMNLAVSRTDGALTVNNGAFFNDTGGAWVFVFDENRNQAVKRQVEFGRRTPSQIEVISGLTSGDKIITSSYRNFLNTERIIVTN